MSKSKFKVNNKNMNNNNKTKTSMKIIKNSYINNDIDSTERLIYTVSFFLHFPHATNLGHGLVVIYTRTTCNSRH